MSYAITWGELSIIEPTAGEVARVAGELARAYNDPANAPLLGHTEEILEHEVIEHYAKLADGGAHAFLLQRDGALAGDGDLRGIASGAAEFAFLIAAPGAQGQGLGTRFATMIHALAFTKLGLDRVFASVIPENVASRRVFDKLGYVLDHTSPYGDDGDIVLRIDRPRFLAHHAAALAEIRIAVR